MAPLRVKAAKLISKVELPDVYLLNRFLRANGGEKIKIEPFASHLPHPPVKSLNLDPCEVVQTIYFTQGIDSDNISYCTFLDPRILVRFFEFIKTKTSGHEWEKLNAQYYDLADRLKFALNESISFKEDIYPPVKTLSLKNVPLASEVNEIKLWKEETAINEFETNISIPETIDCISKFVPDIQKISLLETSDFLNETFILENKKFGLDVKFNSPKIKKLNTLEITNDYPMMDYQNLGISVSKTFGFESEIKIPSDNFENLLAERNYKLQKLIEPVYELSKDEINEALFSIPECQQIGAKFLFNSEFALLSDSFDLGKELQVIAALKLLLQIRAVKKVLLITSRLQEMNLKCNGDGNYKNIWEITSSHLINGFKFKFYHSASKFLQDEEFQNNLCHTTSYYNLEESFIKGQFPYEKIKEFDCIILDDFSKDNLSLDSIKTVSEKAEPNFFWVLSNEKNNSIRKEIQKIYPNRELNVLEREKTIENVPSGVSIYFDYFLPVDEKQKIELDDIFKYGRKKLDDTVQYGNLLRLQPNAFQIVQEAQKKGNFDLESNYTVKIDFLKDQILKIMSREDRLLIYSQFETSGLSEISDLINEIGIEHVSFRQLDSVKDIEEKINYSKRFQGKLIFSTNLKPNGIKFRFPKVSYLINYDNWWSPTTRWSLEDKMETDGKALTVINYYLSDSLESKLNSDLQNKGLLEKNIIDSILPENFYQIYDDKCWSDLFELSYDIFKTSANGSYEIPDLEELVNKSKMLLRALGYSEFSSQASMNKSINNISGILRNRKGNKFITAKCIFSNHLDSDFLKSLIFNMELREDKIFIITNGSISHSNYVLPQNVSLINGNQLKKYHELFQINY